ncbi:helix-turn-helix domain-containing protein [Polyangium mundeleinium]|uniref:Helix-turn-helix transcriptional regulator n=1 Tax=Polyangium mundeleinium TaxID=2995306 RepID=A0ABT5EMR2_9BACT|nr:helix-turn-helix transcriptional regulator [Polyangium mundeleinium]MDC0743113.1 helix-turn-helix transcriptional regulator [Polyangium mundeleinium]
MDAAPDDDQEGVPTPRMGQQTTPDDEGDPVSVPAVLTDEQRDRTLAYLDAYLRQHTQEEAADALGFPTNYIGGVCDRRIKPSVDFAARVAQCSGVGLAAILVGGATLPLPEPRTG